MIGTIISHYRIEARLGQGGMGEVYRAEDISLGRTVALKFLPEALSADPIAHKRFLREARSAAALDHPYICNVFEVSQTEDGLDFIAMEYLEGENLQARLVKGPLTLKEALKYGSELAEALESAHQRGIVHRDLKPSNIMLTPAGHAKIMDFGLAKKLVAEDGREQDISSALTREGTTLGTLSYMSPEQLRGQPVDYRSDIFSLGIVLYEMLGGVNPFRRPQPSETTGAILKEDPAPLDRYTPELPGLLRHTVGKMLAKDPAERFQSIHEVLTNLNQLKEESGKVRMAGLQETSRSLNRTWVYLAAFSGFALGAAIMWIVWTHQASQVKLPAVRSSVLLPDGERLASGFSYRHSVAISPDGLWLAYTSFLPGESEADDGKASINLRRLDRSEVRRIPGGNPFFSTDSRHLGFTVWENDNLWLKRTAVEGGPIELVSRIGSTLGFGFTWLPDDTIVFSRDEGGGLNVVSAVGGEPQQLTLPDRQSGEIAHRLPSSLPHRNTILFTTTYLDWSRAKIMALVPETGEKRELIEGGSDGRYVESGHLLFAREGRLMAVRFDPDRLEVLGEPVPVFEGLVHSIYHYASGNDTGAAQYSVSRDGLLVTALGSVCPEPMNQLAWVDRNGNEEILPLEPRNWGTPRISADGHQLLLSATYSRLSVWIFDLRRQVLRRQTSPPCPPWSNAVWGPGREQYSMGCDFEILAGIFVEEVDSPAGSGELLAKFGSTDLPALSSWHVNGRKLAYVDFSPESNHDILILDREGDVEPFLKTKSTEINPEFSPDGRWIAYSSNEFGRMEVFVRPFPGPGKPVQVSTNGGMEPCWSPDGQQIFYTVWGSFFEKQVFAVTVNIAAAELRPEPPKKLFDGNFFIGYPIRGYDVAPNGRFLVVKWDQDHRLNLLKAQAPNRIELVQNWFEELRSRVPVE